MHRRRLTAAASIALLLAAAAAAPAGAQGAASNLEKLGQFKTTGASPDIPLVPQTGPKADAIKKNLTRIKLPAGFHISLYALVPDARAIAVGPQGVATFVGTRKNRVYAVTDRAKMGAAEEVKPFASTLSLVIPNGVCFSKDGVLYIIEQNRVLAYPAAEFFYESPDVVALPVVAQGGLIPKDEESYNHTARVCRIGPDDKLYIALGQPFNVPPPEELGQNFGFPWYGGGHTRTEEYKTETPPADIVFPEIEMVAHAADLGMTFYTGKVFPATYQNAIFSAQHGSWNRTVPIGARVMVTYLKEDGTADRAEPFAEGWLTEDGEYIGRPVDVAQLRDGSLLVSDDFAGALYRVWYDGK